MPEIVCNLGIFVSLKSCVNGVIRISAPSLNILRGILSKPSQFLIFKVLRICMMLIISVMKFSFPACHCLVKPVNCHIQTLFNSAGDLNTRLIWNLNAGN